MAQNPQRKQKSDHCQEHGAVIASEKNTERRAYYELLYETGAAQTDAANLRADNIDWQNGVLVYRRKKLGPFSEPCRLTMGRKLRALLTVLPRSGDLFPEIKRTSANHRSAEFTRRCRVAGISGVSLLPIGIHGLNLRRSANIHNDSPNKRSAITALRYTR